MLAVRCEPFLDDRAELAPERAHRLRLVLPQLADGLERLLDREVADRLDLPVVLEDLARHVQREVLAVDDPLQEAQPFRQQRLPVVHDVDPLHVELHALRDPFPVIQIERGPGGDEQQHAGVERALHRGRDGRERVVPVVGEVAIELVVLVVGDVAARAGPDRLHRVEGLVLDHRLRQDALHRLAGVVEHRLLPFHPHANRMRHEIGVLLHDLAQHEGVGVVPPPVLFVGRLEVQHHGGAGLRPRRVVECVGAVTRRLPADGLVAAGTAGGQGDPVRDHERRVEADAELPDQVRGGGLGPLAAGGLLRLQRGEEFPAAGARDGADVPHHLVASHPDAVVGDGEGSRLPVGVEPNIEVALREEARVRQPLDPQPVQGVGAVRNELAEEDVLLGIERVNHQVQELLYFGGERVLLGAHR